MFSRNVGKGCVCMCVCGGVCVFERERDRVKGVDKLCFKLQHLK